MDGIIGTEVNHRMGEGTKVGCFEKCVERSLSLKADFLRLVVW